MQIHRAWGRIRLTMPRGTKPAVTEKNTKNEILEAYQHLLAQVEGETVEEPTLQDQELLKTAANQTVEKITTELSQLRLTANQTISKLTEQLTEEAERYTTLQKAITFAQQELTEIHQIKTRAGMLKRMVELQKQEEEQFAKEMQERKQAWLEEQKNYDEQLKRTRAHEQEEYYYQQKLKRQRELDAWEEERRKRERVLQEEQEKYQKQQAELEELRTQVDQFPMQLEKAVKEAVNRALLDERKDAEVKRTFAKQEADNKAQVAALRIVSLEKTVKEQDEEIIELKRQLEAANRQVKEIAVAVIEGPKRERDADISSRPQVVQPQK